MTHEKRFAPGWRRAVLMGLSVRTIAATFSVPRGRVERFKRWLREARR